MEVTKKQTHCWSWCCYSFLFKDDSNQIASISHPEDHIKFTQCWAYTENFTISLETHCKLHDTKAWKTAMTSNMMSCYLWSLKPTVVRLRTITIFWSQIPFNISTAWQPHDTIRTSLYPLQIHGLTGVGLFLSSTVKRRI